jgi:hypothetical protein
MNLGELIRAANYELSRHPDLGWQEDVVSKVAAQMLQDGAAKDKETANSVYADLVKNGVKPLHAKWTLRDAMDRSVIQRALAARNSVFLT